MKSVRRKSAPTRSFHLPLPAELADRLRREAARRGRPATAVARQALAEWLRARERAEIHREIASYAEGAAGSGADLDPLLESATIEYLREEEGRR